MNFGRKGRKEEMKERERKEGIKKEKKEGENEGEREGGREGRREETMKEKELLKCFVFVFQSVNFVFIEIFNDFIK